MEYYKIFVPDHNDAMMRISLDNEYYYLRTTWNEQGGFWYLSIYDKYQNLAIGMMKLIPGTIWNFFYQATEGPKGIIGVLTDKETIGRNDFSTGEAELVYIPASNWEA